MNLVVIRMPKAGPCELVFYMMHSKQVQHLSGKVSGGKFELATGR